MAQHADLGAELGRAPQHELEPAASPTRRRDGQQLRPRLAQAGEVPAALERRADDDVAAGREVGERRRRVRRAEPRAVGAGDSSGPRPTRAIAAASASAGSAPSCANAVTPGGSSARDLRRGAPAGAASAAARRDRAGAASPRGGSTATYAAPGAAAAAHAAARRISSACSAARRSASSSGASPGFARAGRRRAGEDERRRARAHPSWNRYTTPVGASAAASIRGSASASTRANVSVLAAISSSRRSTGVASACTPLA